MAQVYLGIGSNVDREQHIRAALQALQFRLGTLVASPVFETESHRDSVPSYYNLVVGAQTDFAVVELKQLLRQIEAENGRVRNGDDTGLCALDIDLLLYDDRSGDVDGVMLPHQDLTLCNYVLYPLSLLAPDRLHPVLKHSFAELWERQQQAALVPVDFCWQPDAN